jgi:hypothetical protein
VPQAGVIALLIDPNRPTVDRYIRDIQEVARQQLVALATLHAVPAIYECREFAASGLLSSPSGLLTLIGSIIRTGSLSR